VKFKIQMVSSSINGGEGPRAILTFKDMEGLVQFREWLAAEIVESCVVPPTRWKLFKAFLRGRL